MAQVTVVCDVMPDLRSGQRFSGRKRCERQRVDSTRKFVLQKLVDEPMTFDTGLARKYIRDDKYAEMAFASSRRATVTGMKLRLIDDIEPCRLQPDHQLFSNPARN